MIAAIEGLFSGLACSGLEPDGFKFRGQSAKIDAASFYWDKATLAQLDAGDARLAEAAAEYQPLLVSGLGIASMTRIGHRIWSCYEMTPVEANRWLADFPVWSLTSGTSQLGQPHANGVVLRSYIEPGIRLRLEINAGGAGFPNGGQYQGIILDADFGVERPQELPADTGAFIESNFVFFRENIDSLFKLKS